MYATMASFVLTISSVLVDFVMASVNCLLLYSQHFTLVNILFIISTALQKQHLLTVSILTPETSIISSVGLNKVVVDTFWRLSPFLVLVSMFVESFFFSKTLTDRF